MPIRGERYGCGVFRPSWLQWLNNIVGAVIFISIGNLLLNFTEGLLGVIITTMERRFDLSSSQSSWMASSYQFGAVPMLIIISVFGTRIHRPRLLSVGLSLMAVGCTVFFIPQFTAPAYRPQDLGRADAACHINGSSAFCDDHGSESLSYYLPVFIFARVLTGIGAAPIYSAGINYMDDCSTREKFAMYSGIFTAMAVTGPAIAYVFGALMLEVFSDFYSVSKEELGIDSSDPGWIGCWWLPSAVVAGFCLLTAVPMWGFPRELRGAAELRSRRVTEAHGKGWKAAESSAATQQTQHTKVCTELGNSAKNVLRNPTFLSLTLFAVCENFIWEGLTSFGPKYFESILSVSPTFAGILYGIILVLAGSGGTVVSGLVIEKMRLSCQQIIRIQTVLAVILTAGCLLFILTCDPVDFAGVSVPYNLSSTVDSSSLSIHDACHANCSCHHVLYEPICSHDKVQYFSACHAGCITQIKTSEAHYDYYNCSCIATQPQDLSLPLASSGRCSSGVCGNIIGFFIVFFIVVFALNWCVNTNTSALLRSVHSSHTSFALGFQVICIKLLGTIPGPIMMGVAFDNSCLLWLPLTCGDSSGSCSFYDSRALSINFVILLTAVSCVSVVAMIIANVMYRPFDTVGSIMMEVSFNGDVSDDVSEDQKEVVETKSISDEKTNDCADTVIWTTEEKPVIQPSDVTNLAFVLDDNLETSQL